jgi:hypothetical protein
MKPFDFLIVGAAFLFTVYCALAVYAGPRGGERALIRGEEGRWVFPLDAEETVEVAGPLGITVVEIREARVRVLSSPCANQTCVAAGHVDAGGQWVACLPNMVFVMIESAARGEDADAGTW